MHQYFICKENEIDDKINSLTKLGVSADGWTKYYLDKITNEEWHLTKYEAEMQGGGISVLKRIPEPTIEELINIATRSLNKNDIIGASLELHDRERNNKEDFREMLISELVKNDIAILSDFEKERLRLIIYESNLFDSTNRRNVVGKHYTEIENDANYFRTISKKAKEILNQIGKYSR